MRFSVAPLLLQGDFISAGARAELAAAYAGPEAERTRHLQEAARILYREAALDCTDARELVGLDA